MFQINDVIRGIDNRTYSITNSDSLCKVIAIDEAEPYRIKVLVIEHNCFPEQVGRDFWVDERKFVLVHHEGTEGTEGTETEREIKKEEKKMIIPAVKPYKFNLEVIESIKRKEEELLTQYHHRAAPTGLKAQMGEYMKNKAYLVGIFSKHPNWDEKNLAVVFSKNYKRGMDKGLVCDFIRWFSWKTSDIFAKNHDVIYEGKTYTQWHDLWVKTIGEEAEKARRNKEYIQERNMSYDGYDGYERYLSSEDYEKCVKITDGINYISSTVWNENDEIEYIVLDHLDEGKISSAIADKLNEYFPTLKAVAGQKLSRVVGKLGKLLEVDQIKEIDSFNGRDRGWNRRFAMFSDNVNPLYIRRHTIISCNPLDYLTASFGHNWASCHTIDARNERNCDHNYSGMYMSGDLSYMLDSVSFVFYTVDERYKGNEYWTQDKMQRCMFHYSNGELVQGRVYPDGRDGGDESYAAQFREVVQSVLSECLGIPNLWVKTKKGMRLLTETIGTHYPDYIKYSDCCFTHFKGITNLKKIRIGHNPICPYCGEEHHESDSLNCNDCKGCVCDHCGEFVSTDDAIVIDNNVYCCEDCAREAGYVYTEDNSWCSQHNCMQDDYTGEWYYYYEEREIVTEDGHHYISEENAIADGYRCARDTNGWYPEDELNYCEACEEYYTDDAFDFENNICDNCVIERAMEEMRREEVG